MIDEELNCNLQKEFELRLIKNINSSYKNRNERNIFSANWIKNHILPQGGDILNIGGGGKRHLENNISSTFYNIFEIDILGDCDLIMDLDKVDKLPFEDSSKDLCCGFDVLEHLENFHLINQELFRVSSKYVLISLPNSAKSIYGMFLKNRNTIFKKSPGGIYSKFYGLPFKKPDDRHRWWITFYDIVRFYLWFERVNNCKVNFVVPSSMTFKKQLAKLLFGKYRYNTFFCTQIWILISK